MEKFIKCFTALLIMYLGMAVWSCSDEVDCGGFASSFIINDVFMSEARMNEPDDLFNTRVIGSSDTISYDSLLLIATVSFDAIGYHQPKGSVISSAYACSPAPLTPLDTITSIEVFSIRQTGVVSFEVIEQVTDDFDIITLDNSNGLSDTFSLSQFNTNDAPASTEYFLLLNEAPEEIVNIGYQVVFNFSNRNPLEASSKFLYISP